MVLAGTLYVMGTICLVGSSIIGSIEKGKAYEKYGMITPTYIAPNMNNNVVYQSPQVQVPKQ